uniref:Uncharacterized protein n=1 Tax=Arundo donax TaxID=35708 RepID=A0A0A9AT01_ARUDO
MALATLESGGLKLRSGREREQAGKARPLPVAAPLFIALRRCH